MTETVFVVPLTNVPQQFDITIAGRQLNVTCKWNEFQGWVLDVYDSNGDPRILNLPLVTGCDLLGQYAHIDPTGKAIVYTDGDQYAPPTINNLGSESNLYLVVDV